MRSACLLSFSNCSIRFRDAQGLAEVVTLSRSFLSSTAKAKTAKLSAAFFFVSPKFLEMLTLAIKSAIYFRSSMVFPIVSKLRSPSSMTILNGLSEKSEYF